MTDFNKVLLGISIACVIGAMIYQTVRAKRKHAGESGEKRRVARILRQICKMRGFEMIDDAVLLDEGLTGWADHIVVGYFGALLVYDLTFMGHYSGKVDDAQWLVMLDEAAGRIKNPFPIAGQCTGRVNTLLKKAGMKLPVYRVAVITGRGGKKHTQTYIASEDVILLGGLRGYLTKAKFDEDRKVDIAKAAAALRAGLQKRPE